MDNCKKWCTEEIIKKMNRTSIIHLKNAQEMHQLFSPGTRKGIKKLKIIIVGFEIKREYGNGSKKWPYKHYRGRWIPRKKKYKVKLWIDMNLLKAMEKIIIEWKIIEKLL